MAVTAIINFEISNTNSNWEQGIYAAQPTESKTGIFNFAQGYDPDSPQKYMVVVNPPPPQAMVKIFQSNANAFFTSKHIIETTQINLITTDPVSGEVPIPGGIV